MTNLVNCWLRHKAKWWQFWYPQSGILGGTLVVFLFWIPMLWFF